MTLAYVRCIFLHMSDEDNIIEFPGFAQDPKPPLSDSLSDAFVPASMSSRSPKERLEGFMKHVEAGGLSKIAGEPSAVASILSDSLGIASTSVLHAALSNAGYKAGQSLSDNRGLKKDYIEKKVELLDSLKSSLLDLSSLTTEKSLRNLLVCVRNVVDLAHAGDYAAWNSSEIEKKGVAEAAKEGDSEPWIVSFMKSPFAEAVIALNSAVVKDEECSADVKKIGGDALLVLAIQSEIMGMTLRASSDEKVINMFT